MFVRMIYDEGLAHASYLIGCQGAGVAAVIDPRRDVREYIEIAASEGMRITAAIETHVHADFVSGVRELEAETGATIMRSGEGDVVWRGDWHLPGGRSLKDGDEIEIGSVALRVIHTPGHTAEHIALVVSSSEHAGVPMSVCTGDCLFVGDVGRPDLLETAMGVGGAAAASAAEQRESVQRLMDLPDHVQVWPAHGAGSACGKSMGGTLHSTIGYERAVNRMVSLATAGEAFDRDLLSDQPEAPEYFARAKRMNIDGPARWSGVGSLRAMSHADATEAVATRDAAILDTRPWDQFRMGHMPGALSVPLDGMFCTVAGSYVGDDQPVVLVAEPADAARARDLLSRVGVDRILGVVHPAEVAIGEREYTPECSPTQLSSMLEAGGVSVLDVRRADEFAEARLPGADRAVHVRLPSMLGSIAKGGRLAVMCRSGKRSARATSYLRRHGFDAMNVAGGIKAWIAAGLPTEGDG